MRQGIEGNRLFLPISQQCYSITTENIKAYLTRRTDDLAKIVFSNAGRIETPGAAKCYPALKQYIPCNHVIGGIKTSLVGSYPRYLFDRAKKIKHQIQLMGGQVVKKTTP